MKLLGERDVISSVYTAPVQTYLYYTYTQINAVVVGDKCCMLAGNFCELVHIMCMVHTHLYTHALIVVQLYNC